MPVTDDNQTNSGARVSGFYAEYFALPTTVWSLDAIDFEASPTATGTVAALDLGGSNDSFWENGPADSFAARYTASLSVETAGSYTFYLSSDDGAAVYIDGEQVIDNDGAQAATVKEVTLDLDAGQHDIEIQYFEARGGQTLKLEWAGPDTDGTTSVITEENVTYVSSMIDGDIDSDDEAEEPTTDQASNSGNDNSSGAETVSTGNMAGLMASYFILPRSVDSLDDIDFSATPDATAVATDLNHYQTSEAFYEDGASQRFAAAYQGQLNVEIGGEYTIFLTSDDGSALYVDGQKIIDNDGLHGARELEVTLTLAAGVHEIDVRYFENYGSQTLRLEWSGPDSNSERVLVGGDTLTHDESYTAGVKGATVGSTIGPMAAPGLDRPVLEFVKKLMGQDSDDSGAETPTANSGDGDADQGGTPVSRGDLDGDGMDMGTDDGEDGGHDMSDGDMGGDDDHDMGGDNGGHTDHEIADDDDDDDHSDHGSSQIDLPETSAEVAAFVQEVMSAPEMSHSHDASDSMMAEHSALLDLVPRSEATHVAISNGDWFDPSTWHNGEVPDANAKVLIPEGVSVTYDGESDESLFTVRVDGELSFATDTDTKMLVDTFVVTSSGRLEIGTADNPIQSNVTTDIVIANNGDIDVNWDSTLISRGLVSMGEVEIHGAEKTSFLKVSDAPMAGDTSVQLSEVPEGWQVGDTILISGTHMTGWEWTGSDIEKQESQDEEVTITAINGNVITFDQALQYDHDTPRDDLFAYVANTTRNITVSSEDGASTDVNHRGHVMFMHNDDVDVRYAAFDDLGRTDKSESAFDVGTLDTVTSDSNIKGRYSFHFHKTGTDDQENPAMAVGNTVSGSPGWGFVHHSSNANFTDNVAYDIFGAAFAAEDGDETGIWARNMAIDVEGYSYGAWDIKAGDDTSRHDNGRTGDGFFFAGRLVEAAENVAINTTNGYVWFHRSAPQDSPTEGLDYAEIAFGADEVEINQSPIQGFRDNEAFGTQTGLVVIKNNPEQHNHEIRSVFDGFLNWETANGVDISYTAHYTLIDFDLVSADETLGNHTNTGVNYGANAFDIVVNGLNVEGFDTGVNTSNTFHFSQTMSDVGNIFIDVEMSDVGTDYNNYNAQASPILSSDDLVDGRLSFDMTGDTILSRGQALELSGTKTDSIGSRDRWYDSDEFTVSFEELSQLIVTEGYYKDESGRNILLVEDFVADRATGELLKFAHVVVIDMTDNEINNSWFVNQLGGAQYNGTIDLGGTAPAARDDNVATRVDTGVYIDVIANDTDADGDDLIVDGFMDPGNGDVYMQDDGRLLYEPNIGFSGTDTFRYWASDEEGHFAIAEVTIEVWDS